MKIALVLNNSEKTDGLNRYSHSLAKTLAEKEAVEVVHPSKIFLPNFIPKFFRLFGKDVNFILETRPLLLNKNPSTDILHFTSQNLIAPLNFYKFKHVVTTVHDIMPKSRNDGPKTGFLDYLYYRLILHAIKKSDRIITTAKCIKEDIIKYLAYPADRIEIVYEGVDQQKFNNNIKPKKLDCFSNKNINLLFVGSEFPRKNLVRLLKAVALLKKEFPNICLIKVGEPQYTHGRKDILRAIKELHLETAVKFIGHVEKDLPYYYYQADLFVFPSLYEGFGLPPLEAMACGCPVVASNCGSLPEILGDAALLADPYNPEDIALKIKSVITNNKLRQKLIKRGIKRANQFTWGKCASRTIKVYESLIK